MLLGASVYLIALIALTISSFFEVAHTMSHQDNEPSNGLSFSIEERTLQNLQREGTNAESLSALANGESSTVAGSEGRDSSVACPGDGR